MGTSTRLRKQADENQYDLEHKPKNNPQSRKGSNMGCWFTSTSCGRRPCFRPWYYADTCFYPGTACYRAPGYTCSNPCHRNFACGSAGGCGSSCGVEVCGLTRRPCSSCYCNSCCEGRRSGWGYTWGTCGRPCSH